MAAKPMAMQDLKKVLALLDQGLSRREIHRMTGFSRKVIFKYEELLKQSNLSVKAALQMQEEELAFVVREKNPGTNYVDEKYMTLSSYFSYFDGELKRTGVTLQLLWKEYLEKHPDGYMYSQFCYHYQKHTQSKDLTMRLYSLPGSEVQVDFAGKKFKYLTPQDEEKECQMFVSILPYSGYTYAQATETQQQQELIGCLNNSFIYFGGVPQRTLTDNMKSAVKKANRYEPDFTDLCVQFSIHYHTFLDATRVAHPKDKPSVEKAVHLVYQRIYAVLRNERFNNVFEVNRAIRKCLEDHNSRPFRDKTYSRKDIFLKEEKHLLNPLPEQSFDVKNTVMAKVSPDCHLKLGQDNHFYSVPYQYAHETVKVVYDSRIVEIFFNEKRIAIHQRIKKGSTTTNPEHLPPNQQAYREFMLWDDDYFLNQAKKISPLVEQVIQRMLSSRMTACQGYKAALGVLRLAKKVGNDRLVTACEMSLKANSPGFKYINQILQLNRDINYRKMYPLSPPPNLFTSHENIRGKEAFE